LGRRRGRLGGELLVGAGGAGLGGRHGRDPGGADRGGALDKARFRLAATIIGVTASIVIVALFSQTRDLMLAVFAAWVGLCVCAAGLLDGNHAYAAVLSGYTVALIAIQQLEQFPLMLHRNLRRRDSLRILAERSGAGRRRWLARGLGLSGRQRRARGL